MDLWAGLMEMRSCLGTVCPRLVSVYGRSIRKEAVCVATVKAEGDRERVMLVGFRETWGS